MGVFASLGRRKSLWVGLTLVAAAAFFLYPSVDRTVRLFFAERALFARKAEYALDWLKSIPERQTNGKREFLLARTYRRLGQQDFAREHLQLAFEFGYPVEQLEREQWLAMAQSGQMREAEPHLRKLLQDPRDDGQEICEAFVNGYFRNRQFAKALPIIDAWQADFPEDPQPHAFRGAGFQEAEDWSSAIAEYRKVLALDPEDTEIRLQLAVCLKTTRKYDEAATEFRQCLKKTPNDPKLLAEWGDVLLSIGTVKEATAVFEQLLAIEPQNTEGRLGIAGIHLMNGEKEVAEKLIRTLYAERPYDSRVQYSLASALQSAGKTQEAAEMFERVAAGQAQLERKQQLMDELLVDPNLVNHRFEIAKIAMNHESPAEGLRWLLSVIDLDPGYTAAYVAIADYYHTMGNAELEQKYRMQAESLNQPN